VKLSYYYYYYCYYYYYYYISLSELKMWLLAMHICGLVNVRGDAEEPTTQRNDVVALTGANTAAGVY
jgi:hypothetical protein